MILERGVLLWEIVAGIEGLWASYRKRSILIEKEDRRAEIAKVRKERREN